MKFRAWPGTSFWFLLTLLPVTACATAPLLAETASASSTPSAHTQANPTTASPTDTPRPRLDAAPTLVVLPTPTAAPPTATPPGMPPTPTPTPDWRTYRLEAAGWRSPDGLWSANVVVAFPDTAEGVAYADFYHVLLKLIYWPDVRDLDLIDEWRRMGLGFTIPQALRWTRDGRALFIGDVGVPDGCGPPFFENLLRVDLATGEVAPLGVDAHQSVSFSPHGRELIFFRQGAPVIRHLDSGQEVSLPFEAPSGEWWPGEIVWSPQGDAFLLPIVHNPCEPPEVRSGALVLGFIGGDPPRTLLQDDTRALSVVSWPAAGLAQLVDKEGHAWWLALQEDAILADPPPELSAAYSALRAYFDALADGRYTEVDRWYGGSYEVLIEDNPDVDPADRAALWQRACQANGFQCLPVHDTVLASWPTADEFQFLVRFEWDGKVFTRGPCCGADLAWMPPESQFSFTVKKGTDQRYRVLELPVYTP